MCIISARIRIARPSGGLGASFARIFYRSINVRTAYSHRCAREAGGYSVAGESTCWRISPAQRPGKDINRKTGTGG